MSTWKFLKRNRVDKGLKGKLPPLPTHNSWSGDLDDLEVGVLGVEETLPLYTPNDIDRISNPPKPHHLQGLTICFTGKMTRTREHMNALTYEYGMIPCSTVHSGVDILVIADCNIEQPASKWSTKRNMARRLHVKTMSERLFLSNIRNPADPPSTRR